MIDQRVYLKLCQNKIMGRSHGLQQVSFAIFRKTQPKILHSIEYTIAHIITHTETIVQNPISYYWSYNGFYNWAYHYILLLLSIRYYSSYYWSYNWACHYSWYCYRVYNWAYNWPGIAHIMNHTIEYTMLWSYSWGRILLSIPLLNIERKMSVLMLYWFGLLLLCYIGTMV